LDARGLGAFFGTFCGGELGLAGLGAGFGLGFFIMVARRRRSPLIIPCW
jgi:hypothetical protein